MKFYWIYHSSKSQLTVLCTIFVIFLRIQNASAEMLTYSLNEFCSGTLDMTKARVQAGRLLLTRPGVGPFTQDCFMIIKAPANRRLSFKFHQFNIKAPQGCGNDHVEIYEDEAFEVSLTGQLCNTNRVPDKAYVTSGGVAVVNMKKVNYLGDQMEVVFTAFSFYPCFGGDYRCDNDHCIAGDLYCNGYDNCGDESDLCFLHPDAVIGIIVAVVVVIVIIAIIVAVYFFRRQQKIRREREKNFIIESASISPYEFNKAYLHDPHDGEKRSHVSDISSVYSSSPKKHSSILSKRDHQWNAVGYSSNTKRHGSMERYRYLHPYDLEMANRVHYISLLDDGKRSRPSTLERNIVRKDSKKAKHIESMSKSQELRPPFYFDKDGYFSDSNIDTSNRDETYAVPKTGKRNKSLSRQTSSVHYANEPIIHQETKKEKKKKTKKELKEAKKESKKKMKEDKKDVFAETTGTVVPSTSHEALQTTVSSREIFLQDPSTSDSSSSSKQKSALKTSSTRKHGVRGTSRTSAHTNRAYNRPARSRSVSPPGSRTMTTTTTYRTMRDGTRSPVSVREEFDPPDEHWAESHAGWVEVRHRDGSPYTVHEVDTDKVNQRLRLHPEDAGDVTDHVISFRSYPAPVPYKEYEILSHGGSSSRTNGYRTE